MPTATPTILVVDDHPINITLIKKRLEREGMRVITANSGSECLTVTRQEDPDLILLDVMMPQMDGYETCRRLKQDTATRSIPVVFLTASDSKEGMLEGLEAGGIDYLFKPVDLDEMVARVRSQLKYQAIIKQNLDLTERLSDARRAAALGALSQGISHNLNNLLGVIYGFVGLARLNVNKPAELRKNLDKIEEGITRMTKIIRQVTSVSTRLQVTTSRLDPTRLAENAVTRLHNEFRIPGDIEIVNDSGGIEVMGNIEILEDALGKLLLNAWESYAQPPAGQPFAEIHIRTAMRRGRRFIEYHVLDRGRGLDPEIRDHIFEPFVSTKTTVGVGMGLTIARHAIRNLGGEIELVDREDGSGVDACIALPAAESARISAA